jgi:hypothetical protein
LLSVTQDGDQPRPFVTEACDNGHWALAMVCIINVPMTAPHGWDDLAVASLLDRSDKFGEHPPEAIQLAA